MAKKTFNENSVIREGPLFPDPNNFVLPEGVSRYLDTGHSFSSNLGRLSFFGSQEDKEFLERCEKRADEILYSLRGVDLDEGEGVV